MVHLTLPVPRVVRSFLEDGCTPPLPACCLHWDTEEEESDHVWELPEGVRLSGPLPGRFGLAIQRLDGNTYRVRLLWDQTIFIWPALSRGGLLSSCLAPVLSALGTDLWHLLEQPISPAERGRPRAA
jgi:hypothetical protein